MTGILPPFECTMVIVFPGKPSLTQARWECVEGDELDKSSIIDGVQFCSLLPTCE